MSRTTFVILAAGLAVAACNQASEQLTDDAGGASTRTANDRIEKVADKLFSALNSLPGKAVTD